MVGADGQEKFLKSQVSKLAKVHSKYNVNLQNLERNLGQNSLKFWKSICIKAILLFQKDINIRKQKSSAEIKRISLNG